MPIVETMRPVSLRFKQRLKFSPKPRCRLGPTQHEGKLHDRASYRYYWELLERAHVTGMDIPELAKASLPETLPIIYRDEYIVVIDKPSGLLVLAQKLTAMKHAFAIQILRDQIGQKVWPAHRLDRGNMGIFTVRPKS